MKGLIAALALSAFFASWGGSQIEAEELTIAVIPKGTTHEFWKSIHAGAVKAAGEVGVEIIWKGPLKEDDREAQIAEVENFISRGVAGIVLAPLDDMALRVPVMNATRSGIPVVIIDSGLKSRDFVSFVATDNKKGGTLAGKRLAELLGGKGKVVMLRYQEGSASTMNREQGFMDAIAEYPEIEVVSANQYGGATTESAYRASENLLAPLRKEEGGLSIDGIFCPNESTTFGMLRALQDGELAGTVRFVGFDSSEKLVQGLAAGQIDGLVLQNPMRMGYLGVKTLVAHLRGKEVEKRVDTGVHLVTQENMKEPEMAQLLKPELEKWLK
ncbi:MAG: substrate-binding domain-containing protein [Gemmatimonadetes bacterium]|jgi:ribose transport system substrate-binding protein|nr:substrate-binding domain-containing protein [Gemmatimonadota bacterium]